MLVLLICVAIYSVYLILEVFVTPLLWAVLVGTFLYPFKRTMTNRCRDWLEHTESSFLFTLGIIVLPFYLTDSLSESITRLLFHYWKFIIAVILIVPTFWLAYYFIPGKQLLDGAMSISQVLRLALEYIHGTWVYTLVVIYISIVIFYWNEETRLLLTVLAVPLWLLILFHLVTLAGEWQVFILFLLFILIIVGWYSAARHNELTSESSVVLVELKGLISNMIIAEDTTLSDISEHFESDQTIHQRNTKDGKTTFLNASPSSRKLKSSHVVFLLLGWFILVCRISHHYWLVPLLLIPITIVLIKRLVLYIYKIKLWPKEVVGVVYPKWVSFKQWLAARESAVLPRPIKGLWRVMKKADRLLLYWLRQSLDKICSVAVIVACVISATVITVLLLLQIHKESMHVLQVTRQVMNDSVQQFPAINKMLPEGKQLEHYITSVTENTHSYSRQWITSNIRKILQGAETKSIDSDKIEKQILEIWDKIYELWVVKILAADAPQQKKSFFSTSGSQPDKKPVTLYDIWVSITSFGVIHIEDIVAFIQENIHTLSALLQSIWSIVLSNLSVAFSAVTSVLKLLLGGGSVVMNFLFEIIVFLTTLFLLLSSSTEVYKPMEWIMAISLVGPANKNKLGQAVEQAISSVFMASLKMSMFYCLYTWHTHLLFNLQIIFIPAAMAAVLASIPFVGTYWAVLPGFMELYLTGNTLRACLLLLLHLVPPYFVDSAIYSEIKGGGHPYLTGLAIAGGAFWMGIEGAICGPMLLCCLFVVINIYSSVLESTDGTSSYHDLSCILARSHMQLDRSKTPEQAAQRDKKDSAHLQVIDESQMCVAEPSRSDRNLSRTYSESALHKKFVHKGRISKVPSLKLISIKKSTASSSCLPAINVSAPVAAKKASKQYRALSNDNIQTKRALSSKRVIIDNRSDENTVNSLSSGITQSKPVQTAPEDNIIKTKAIPRNENTYPTKGETVIYSVRENNKVNKNVLQRKKQREINSALPDTEYEDDANLSTSSRSSVEPSTAV